MAETWNEQLSRVRLMADDCDTWDLSDNDIAALRAVLERLDALEAELAEARKWYPISEAHEDHGTCVYLSLTDDGGAMIANACDIDFAEKCAFYEWTHFQPIKLSTKDAERLAAIDAAMKGGSNG